MIHRTLPRTLIVAACLALPLGALAQELKTADRYDRALERTATGIILQVIGATGTDGTVGVHLNVKADDAVLKVHVGPALFVGENNFWFQIDDKIEITGADVTRDGITALWARQIVKDGKTLKLRDDNGAPLWKTTADDPDGCGVSHVVVR